MSTMSFLRNVSIKTPKKAKALIDALERSAVEQKHEVKFSRPVREPKGEELKKILDKVKW